MCWCVSIHLCVVRAKAFQSIGFLPYRSLWQASACKNVTCQTTRIDACSHSASFQSPLRSEAPDGTGCTSGGEQQRGKVSGSKVCLQTRRKVGRHSDRPAQEGCGDTGALAGQLGKKGCPSQRTAASQVVEEGLLEAEEGLDVPWRAILLEDSVLCGSEIKWGQAACP